MQTQGIIYHHYPQSPVAEKIRVAFGVMGASWHSVIIPRLPPKPDLTALTGGYRRTPVMQIGADIYCDSQCILRELDRRFPDQALYPATQSLQALGFSQWTDSTWFTHVIRVVLGHDIEALPKEFLVDRARLYFGPDWTPDSVAAGVAHSLSQCQAALDWMERSLAAGNHYIAGEEPGLYDVSCYYLVWFLRGRYSGGPALLECYPHVSAWESRVLALGHGSSTDLDSQEAIKVARESTPETVGASHSLAQDVGNLCSVQPDGDGGDPAVAGTLVQLTHDRIVIAREDPLAGVVHVHFPRTGYLITPG